MRCRDQNLIRFCFKVSICANSLWNSCNYRINADSKSGMQALTRPRFGSGPGGITPTHGYHTNCSGIGMPENPDIWRVTLCNHGLDCRQRRMGVCIYAHSLSELLPPLENKILYPGVWSDGCDRFFGQQMWLAQRQRIHLYYRNTPDHERPVWAKCLMWYFEEQHLLNYSECGWDFGIWQVFWVAL